jgi:decaprenyl-phosphate phosphoribosyltransferase
MSTKANVHLYERAPLAPADLRHPTLAGHLRILRVDHWIKNVFVLPGIVVALSVDRAARSALDPLQLVIGFLAICLVTSSNYVINEVLDGPFDRHHPVKCRRPVACGAVSIPLAYVQWMALMLAGIALGLSVSLPFAGTLLALWVMGCLYNIPPVRTKDVPYLDVLSEAVNNPLRMLAGWYLTGTSVVPPTSLLLGYWMVGCYFMAIKRFAEYREIGDGARSAAYRKSFAYYNEQRLLISITFYAAHAMLFLGAFIMRYRLELILSFPLVALVMATYLSLGFKENSAAQRPEGLYREPVLMAGVTACAALMVFLLIVDVPLVHTVFVPSQFRP